MFALSCANNCLQMIDVLYIGKSTSAECRIQLREIVLYVGIKITFCFVVFYLDPISLEHVVI